MNICGLKRDYVSKGIDPLSLFLKNSSIRKNKTAMNVAKIISGPRKKKEIKPNPICIKKERYTRYFLTFAVTRSANNETGIP